MIIKKRKLTLLLVLTSIALEMGLIIFVNYLKDLKEYSFNCDIISAVIAFCFIASGAFCSVLKKYSDQTENQVLNYYSSVAAISLILMLIITFIYCLLTLKFF